MTHSSETLYRLFFIRNRIKIADVIMVAIKEGNMDIFTKCINDINKVKRDSLNYVELLGKITIFAMKYERMDMFNIIVDYNLNYIDSIIDLAVKEDNVAVVNNIVERNPDYKLKAVNAAARYNRRELLNIMSDNEIRPYNIANGAAKGGNIELVLEMLEKIDSDSILNSIICEAAEGGQLGLIKHIIKDFSFDVDYNYLAVCAAKGNNRKILEYIIDKIDCFDDIVVEAFNYGNIGIITYIAKYRKKKGVDILIKER